MKKNLRLTESELISILKKIINENVPPVTYSNRNISVKDDTTPKTQMTIEPGFPFPDIVFKKETFSFPAS